VRVGGELLTTLVLGDDDVFGTQQAWSEQSFVVPAEATKAKTPVELVARQGSFASYHYWFIRE